MIESNKLAVLLNNALSSANNSFSLTEHEEVISRNTFFNKVHYYCDWLIKLNVNSVMVYSSPSIEIICLCYALILTNKTYIPVHTSTSPELLSTYIETYPIDLVVMQSELAPQMNSAFSNQLLREDSSAFLYCHLSAAYHSSCLMPGAIFFTSGTSALPKAVYYCYETLYNYLCWCKEEFNLKKEDQFLFTTELSFIASLRPLFIPLLSGANLSFIPNYTNKIQAILHCLNQNNITVLNITPSLFKVLIQYTEHCPINKLNEIQLIILSGEALDATTINYWLEHINNKTVFYNLYGATEFLVPFYKKITQVLDETERLHMGTLRKGCNYKLIPKDDLGYELYVSGDIATTYADNKYTQHSYIFLNNIKFIRTSDLVTLEKNVLFYRSRSQRIIKKYGQIINLDQIEYVLKQSYPLNNFVALIDEQEQNKLHLAIEAQPNEQFLNKIKLTLKQHLPSYMHPKEYHFVEKFPATKSGKIDYLSLKVFLFSQKGKESIWERYFKRFFPQHKVDMNAEIMSLGLESIDYIELTMALYEKMGKWLDVSQITQSTRIADLESCLIEVDMPETELKDRVKLHHVIRSYFLEGKGQIVFFQKYCLKPGINLDKLKQAIKQTINRHFLLSCKIEKIGDNYFFVETEPQSDFTLPTTFSIFSGRKPKIAKITPKSERLIYFYIHREKGKDYLIITYHHVILDGWSAYLLRENIFRSYEGSPSPYFNREEELEYLNKVNNLWLPPQEESLEELRREQYKINYDEYNRDFYTLYSKTPVSRNTTFIISAKQFEQFIKINKLEGFTSSVIFILILQQAFSDQIDINKFLFTISLSNRNLPIPNVDKLITNLATGLPSYFDSEGKTIVQCAEDLKKLFTLYFKNMTYAGLAKIREQEIIPQASFRRVCPIFYTYINHIMEGECVQGKYIDWLQSAHGRDLRRKPGALFRVYNLGSQFVLILNSSFNKGVHDKLMYYIQRLFA